MAGGRPKDRCHKLSARQHFWRFRMRRSCLVAVGAVVVSAVLPLQSFAQSPSLSTMSTTSVTSSNVPESVVMSDAAASTPAAPFEQRSNYRALSSGPAVGVGVKVGTLGVGIQGAVAVSPKVAVRGGFNFLSYSHTFDQDGTNYDASLKLQSLEVALDLMIAGGFRFSPGLLLYNNNHLDATLAVPP